MVLPSPRGVQSTFPTIRVSRNPSLPNHRSVWVRQNKSAGHRRNLFFRPFRIVAPRTIRSYYSPSDFLMTTPFIKSNLSNVTMCAVPRLDITPIPVSPYRIGNPDFMPQSRTVRNTEQRICHLEIRTVRSLYFSPDKTACVWQHVRKSRIFPA